MKGLIVSRVIIAFALLLAGCSKAPDSTAPSQPAPAPAPAASEPEGPPPQESHLGFKPATGIVEATPEQVEKSKVRLRTAAASARAQWHDKTFDEFVKTVYKEKGEGGKYIVSGDTAISDEKQLREFFEQRVRNGVGAPDAGTGGKLIVQAGPDGTWNTVRKKQLTYCVSSAFGSRQPGVVAGMLAATQAWESVADVHYEHIAAQDSVCTASNANVVFDVNPVNVEGEYLARAFFPNEPRVARNVLIDDTAFELSPGGKLQLAGILRHELGHTLGWRHEQTRPEAGTCFEDSDWVPMTRYDDLSVMHYPQCNGAGDWTLTLTPSDKSGAACAYGEATGFQIDHSLIIGTCIVPTPPPTMPVTAQTKIFTAQSVALNMENQFDPIVAKPGTVVMVELTPSGSTQGDADLYVRLGSLNPERNGGKYTCRPYLSTSSEVCEISTREAPRNTVRIMVHGYTAATFDLKVTFVPN